MRFITRGFRYLRAAPLPNVTALIGVGTGLGFGSWALSLWERGHVLEAPVAAILALGWLFGGLCCQMDGLSRFREYQRMKRVFRRYGLDDRVLRLMAPSRCRRDAALQAARESGLGAEARRCFRRLGYRWYHLLPDRIVRNPLHFFTPEFLRSTFWPGKRARG